ncbi:MAG: hypothetical protein GC182_20745 [Rhodopseudomonas sp.]|nr:hypothetical protein [Rhodopseudomonas sp.]
MKNENNAKRPPSHIIWQVIGEKDKAKWVRIGAAWANKDGKGMNLVFDAFPVTGRTVVREVSESEGADAPGGQQ